MLSKLKQVLSLGNGLELCTGLVQKSAPTVNRSGNVLAFAFLFTMVLVFGASSAMAQAATPVEVVEGVATTVTPVWTAIAGLSASAFLFSMIIAFGRKAKK